MPDIHHCIQVTAGLDTVMSLVATGSGLGRWWAEDVVTEEDGRVSLGFFDRATVYRLRLLESGAGGVSWRCESGDEWHDTELRFDARSEGDGVRAAAEGRPRGPLFRRDSLAY